MSGLDGTIAIDPLISTPLLLTTNGYAVPVKAEFSPSGTTNVISCPPTDFIPHIAPFIDIVTPLSSIGRLKLRSSEPTAVRGTIGGSIPAENVMVASIPGDRPWNVGGVTGVGVGTGVGVTVGDPLGVGDGVGVGVAVGDGVGVTDGVGVGDGVGDAVGSIGIRLAPVKKLTVAAV